ncbi:DUF305 domain-containing protein [Cellulosimicrobium protaetiae]|uniref:DUF305 domain-containing protein n=1 Tax=Cellulosimicrobium protaetiae TaxID=2587808 RepID=A0A6M5UCT5_9MICO|nr:DUF305 domain-containing protein [Cellulosimicrobium protaetiae]QJW34973.1 DUF305 domain-containing protein [Cellulosimicrobium protaetiae]
MKRMLVTGLALVTVATLAACSSPEDEPGTDPSVTTSQAPDDDAESSTEFNDADVMFAQMMIPHHEQAIEMSDVVLATEGVDPQVTELATRIKEAQGPEIEQLQEWMGAWGADGAGDHSGHGGMDGMMSEDDVQALDDAEGADAGRLFLEQMIVHHEGAIEMAEVEVEDGLHPGAVEMAQAVVDTQSEEIRTMQDLLASL